jgi:hypothetical protein
MEREARWRTERVRRDLPLLSAHKGKDACPAFDFNTATSTALGWIKLCDRERRDIE